MSVTIMLLIHFLLIKRTYFIFDFHNSLFLHISKFNISSLDLLTNSAIFLHWDRQLSWWFYISQWNTQFWYTDIGNFHDDFMFLIEWRHFHTEISKFPDNFMTWTRYAIFIGWIFLIFWVPYEQTDSTNCCSTLSLARSNKNLTNCPELTSAKILQQRWYAICLPSNGCTTAIERGGLKKRNRLLPLKTSQHRDSLGRTTCMTRRRKPKMCTQRSTDCLFCSLGSLSRTTWYMLMLFPIRARNCKLRKGKIQQSA